MTTFLPSGLFFLYSFLCLHLTPLSPACPISPFGDILSSRSPLSTTEEYLPPTLLFFLAFQVTPDSTLLRHPFFFSVSTKVRILLMANGALLFFCSFCASFNRIFYATNPLDLGGVPSFRSICAPPREWVPLFSTLAPPVANK